MAEKFFRVVGYDKFQHYRDRRPPWIKLHASVFDDIEFERLPDASKAHLMLIWVLASRHDNCLLFDPNWVGKKIGSTEVINLNLLAKTGFIEVFQKRGRKRAASISVAESSENAMLETETETETPIVPFADFWQAYPKRVGKRAALQAYGRAVKRAPPEQILEGLHRFAMEVADVESRFIPNPATWLNADRWLDEPGANKSASKPSASDETARRRSGLVSAVAGELAALRDSPGEREPDSGADRGRDSGVPALPPGGVDGDHGENASAVGDAGELGCAERDLPAGNGGHPGGFAGSCHAEGGPKLQVVSEAGGHLGGHQRGILEAPNHDHSLEGSPRQSAEIG